LHHPISTNPESYKNKLGGLVDYLMYSSKTIDKKRLATFYHQCYIKNPIITAGELIERDVTDQALKILNEQKVHIWDGNSTKEFMESRGLSHYREGDLGSLYGFQWRYWNAPYEGCDADYSGKGIDQLQNAIDMLKDPLQRTSRRIIVSAWNPEQVDGGVLPSCHNFFQFSVTQGNKLSCTLTARSQDVFLGEPFNIASYSFLVHLIAKHCDLEPYEFILYAGNCHIYDDHFNQVKEQITRNPYPFPSLEILNKRENINDYVMEDFKVCDYEHHPQIKGSMRA
jgi:thymidylate synthase